MSALEGPGVWCQPLRLELPIAYSIPNIRFLFPSRRRCCNDPKLLFPYTIRLPVSGPRWLVITVHCCSAARVGVAVMNPKLLFP